MDTGYIKTSVFCGALTCISTVIRYGPRKFFAGNHPFQAAIAVFILGGIGGALLYSLISKMSGQWEFWK
jgi:hypothetical protein